MKTAIGIILLSIASVGLIISGFSEGLGLILVVLKFLEVIDWSWWWVTAPIYGPLIFLTVFIIGQLLIAY